MPAPTPAADGARRPRPWTAALAVLALTASARGDAAPAADRFRERVEPVLEAHCYGCHGLGTAKGRVSLDAFATDDALLGDVRLWSAVLKNVRAGLMPPADEPRPSADEVRALESWIKADVLRVDPDDPDPGRVTLRRLNRVEYRNTIRDLMGIEFNTEEEFPPDDTGYGFDTIGDVLSVSPLLLEKYLQAAESIVDKAVPTVARVVAERTLEPSGFRGEGKSRGERISFYESAKVARTIDVAAPGEYRLAVELGIRGAFDFDPGRCTVVFKVDGEEKLRETLGWGDSRKSAREVEVTWAPGEHTLAFEVEPLTPVEKRKNPLDLRVGPVAVLGPLDRGAWVHPPNYTRFFPRDEPPVDPEARRAYAREVLGRFASKAFRRPVDDRMLDRLVGLAEASWRRGESGFERGVARAMVAVLASPRFLFRMEAADPSSRPGAHPLVDEFSLASRLSYLLWSTTPDDELMGLAARGELRVNLGSQVRRMLADDRSGELVRNFVGQWLQVRDVEGVPINARAVFRREGRTVGLRERAKYDLDRDLRLAMIRETEKCFEYVVREDRSVLELIDADYTFLNERLANFYGIPGVQGQEMRRVQLPEGNPRGGVLTHGSVLTVTSNPTRTSPVKRGLFVLDNILGTPAPPAPPDVPELEAAEKAAEGREPTMRELMEVHRAKPLCASCHARMDPLGLGLENFNALGLYRETERGRPIDSAGTLITGEAFDGVRALKAILTNQRRRDYERCLAEKLLTYAIGRGVEPTDVASVDAIVDRLEREGGKFSALLLGVIESAPFQKRRRPEAPAVAATPATRPAGPDPEPRRTP